MKNGPTLVLRGTFFGCLVLVLLGWLLAGKIKLTTQTEVAFAAALTTQAVQPTPQADPCEVSASYPEEIRQWCELIMREAAKTKLPANLIAAVILQESGGDAEAYSQSGAVGLMQVMPRDGIAASFECINGPCFASRPTIDELMDPAYNIEYGSHMLAGLNSRLGSLRDALKAYGPMDMEYAYADIVLAIYERYQ